MSDAEELIRSLPIWQHLQSITPLKGGVSNESYKVVDAGGAYVARLGEDYPFHQVNRDRENIASRAAFEAGLSPEVVYTAPGVMVLRYIEAYTYEEKDVRANAVSCVEIIKRCHQHLGKHITGQGAIFWVFQILRDYAHILKAGKHRLVPEIPKWIQIVDELERVQPPLPVVFGHHDVLPTNFLDDGKRLWLIDWEYGAFGTSLFDLASLSSNNSFDGEGDKLILDTYFEGRVSEAMWRGFDAMKVASALREAVWGMVSELHLNAPGVDYIAYAEEYLGRYESILSDYRNKYGKQR